MAKSAGKKLKRHHHTVPRFYLKRFADAHGLFMRVPIDGGESRRIGVGDATVRKDFYSFRDEDGHLNDSVEDALSDMEGAAAKVLRMVVDQDIWPLPEDAREVMCTWLAFQHLRVPARRQATNEMADHLLKTLFAAGGRHGVRQRLEEAAGGPVSDEEVERAWAEGTDFSSYELETNNAGHLVTMGEVAPAVVEALWKRTWVLVRFARRTLITSDHPLVQIWDPAVPPWRGQGLSNCLAVCMPLDRRAALMMFNANGSEDRTTLPTTAMAKDLNQRVAASARAAVFHHPDDDLDGINLPEPRASEIMVNLPPEGYIRSDDSPEAPAP